jgi:hypothetical protein
MIGASSDAGGGFDSRYFDLVANRGRALAWQEPYETHLLNTHRYQLTTANCIR